MRSAADGIYVKGGGLLREIAYPLTANAALTVRGLQVTLRGAASVPAAYADGYLVYANALGDGVHVLERPSPTATEDLVILPAHGAPDSVTYDIALGMLRGLRQVGGTIEVLDENGIPRTRMLPPYLVDSAHRRIPARVHVSGCAVDDGLEPTFRGLRVPAGAPSCAVRVSWDSTDVVLPAVLDPSWTATNTLAFARDWHTATPLADGRVLVVGGELYDSAVHLTVTIQQTAEVYDPSSDTWALSGAMTTPRFAHVAAPLADGRVLVAGGWNSVDSSGNETTTPTAEIYDPSLGTFSATGSLTVDRAVAAAVPLADGTVLVIGGASQTAGSAATYTKAVEQYSPTSGTWTTRASMNVRRGSFGAWLLSGKVLVAGGEDEVLWAKPDSEWFDLAAGTWSAVTPLNQARARYGASYLADGKVLVEGGIIDSVNATTTAEVFDRSAAAWTSTTSVPTVIAGSTLTALKDYSTDAPLQYERLVSIGGYTSANGEYESDFTDYVTRFDYANVLWLTTPSLSQHRAYHTATALDDGRVLIAGGYDEGGTLASTLTYAPTPFDVGGTVQGLATGSLVLENNGANPLTVATNGPFAFAGAAVAGQPYDVSVSTQPPGQLCVVQDARGAPTTQDITDITVSCSGACATPQSVLAENFDTITALPINWSTTRVEGGAAAAPWAISTAQSSSSPNAAFVTALPTVTDIVLDSPTYAITSTSAELDFKHAYDLEDRFDGGVLEISIGCASFVDIEAAGGTFLAGGYDTSLYNGFGSRLSGRSAWTGRTSGFISTHVRLPSTAAGHNVVFRWRLGTDASVVSPGWTLDDVSVSP